MNIYEGRPSREQMEKRAKRDRIDIAQLVEAVLLVRHYGVKCYALRVSDRASLVRDGETGVKTVMEPAYLIYSLQRNGTVSNGWGLPRSLREVEVTEVQPFK